VSDQFVPYIADTKKYFLIELIQEGLVVSRMVSKKGLGDIRSENVDMSNDESCVPTRSPTSSRVSAFSQSMQSELDESSIKIET
jgi:hypothetical protein